MEIESTTMNGGFAQQQQLQPQTTNGFSSMPQQQQQQQQQGAPIIGLVVPGAPVLTDFVPMDQTGTKFALTLQSPGPSLPSPLTVVNELVCFLTSPLPFPNHGVLIYWQLSSQQQGQSGFELLGSLTPDRPSEVMRTGWSEHSQFLAIGPQEPAQITIGVSIEPLDSIQNLTSSNNNGNSSSSSSFHPNNPNSRRPLVAHKIAQDLFNFMSSFDTGAAASSNQMVVPKNIFDRWWARFENKSKRDPNFFLKSSD
eukprot:scaffold7770_cov94-Cylindrotheca_fusiformis.AAC.5